MKMKPFFPREHGISKTIDFPMVEDRKLTANI